MNELSLAWRLLRRDFRSGELGILLLALIIAVVSTSAIVLAANRLTRTLVLQAADFLAADMVVTGHAPLPEEWLQEAEKRGLASARTVEFASVVVENGRILLVGVKAVSAAYPLRAHLLTTAGDPRFEEITRTPPAPGQVWVVQRVLGELGLEPGGRLHVGNASLRITRVLTFEPDTRGGFYSLAPRVLMRIEDLPATGILVPGSRVHHHYLFAGPEAELRRFKRWIRPRLHPGQRILDIYEDRPDIGRALSRAQRYLGMAGVIVVLIAGVAVAMASRRYSERHFDGVAVMKCLGANPGRILRLYGWQFLILGLGAGISGALLGWGLEEVLVSLLRPLLPEHLAPAELFTFGFGPLVCGLLLGGFALPPLLRLRRVPPLRVLRRDFLPPPVSAWLVYGLAFAAVAVLLWRFSGNAELTFLVLGGGALLLLFLGGTLHLLLGVVRGGSAHLGLAWRLGLRNLNRQRGAVVAQVLAFCVTLAAMALGSLVRWDLVEAWRAQLPEDAPNYFVINVFPGEVEEFQDFLNREIGGHSSAFYPIVRGRLVAVNGEQIQRRVRPDSVGEAAVNRDLNLTWAPALPVANRLVTGHWWRAQGPGRQVSLEKDLAESLGIQVGDRLGFLIEGRRIEAEVASVRTVQWDSMTPNFYVIFAPGDLEGFSATYMTSFYLPPGHRKGLAKLARRFPHVTLLDVEMILRHLRTMLQQVGVALEAILGFALLAGVMVLLAAVRSSMDERIHQGALLRTLGARRRLLVRSQWVEFTALGLLAGVLAAAITEGVAWGLYVRIFAIDFRPHPILWWAVPLLGALLTAGAGVWSTRGVLHRSPLSVLRGL